jgi:hypothetical protein
MSQYNRVKCAASIGQSGEIEIGAPVTGYRAPPVELWQHGSQTYSKKGMHQYLLEDAGGSWEIGYVTVSATNGPSIRTITESSDGGFTPGTGGLVLIMTGSVSNVWACEPAPPSQGASANQTSMAAGRSAAVRFGTYSGLAVGTGAYVAARNGTALGANSVAYQPNEVAIGNGVLRRIYAFWGGDNANSGAPFAIGTDDEGSDVPINFGAWDAIRASRSNGIFRITGTIVVWDDEAGRAMANCKVIDVDYQVWINAAASTATVMGSPSFTDKYVGSATPNSSFSVHATSGAPVLSTSSVTAVSAEALLEIHDFQTIPASDSGVPNEITSG